MTAHIDSQPSGNCRVEDCSEEVGAVCDDPEKATPSTKGKHPHTAHYLFALPLQSSRSLKRYPHPALARSVPPACIWQSKTSVVSIAARLIVDQVRKSTTDQVFVRLGTTAVQKCDRRDNLVRHARLSSLCSSRLPNRGNRFHTGILYTAVFRVSPRGRAGAYKRHQMFDTTDPDPSPSQNDLNTFAVQAPA